MSSTQTYINGKDRAAYVDGMLYSEQSEETKRLEPVEKSEEKESGETVAGVPMQMSAENAEVSAAIPGLGEQLEDLDEMTFKDVKELLGGIETCEKLFEMQEDARRRAKLLARLKLADQSTRCAHIKGNNEPCGSPAMKNDTFCYFHSEARKLRDAEQAVAKAMEVPVLDDLHGVQLAIMRVCGLLVGNKIEEGTARAMFEGLGLAQKAVSERRLKLA